MRRREFVGLVGSAAVWPALAQAEPPIPAIGVLTATKMDDWVTRALTKGLGEAGYAEGRNLTIVRRSAEGRLDRLAALAADLVGSKVSVIVATGGPVPTRAAEAATRTIPIVFAYGGDPVADGLVASFNHPGGNVTGATFIGSAFSAKRLELLKQIAPGVADVALLVNPKGTLAGSQVRDATVAARTLGQRLHVIDGANESEIDEAFTTMSRLKVGGLLVGTDPTYAFLRRDQLVGLASRHRIPAIYDSRSYTDVGGLISYGTDVRDVIRQGGVYVGRILKGEKPADLPVEQPTKFELVINLATAKTLGLTVPPPMLARADEVIE